MQFSKQARTCLETLHAGGYEAYVVGGCVRDFLLHLPVSDYDITTSATPQQVCALFPRTVPTGMAHGTVTVLLDGASLEVTSFRREHGYHDARHPSAVSFDTDLRGDLSRRDFTINAMAVGLDDVLIDPFGGQSDLARGCIRCVGDARLRMQEDALRILRALRFSARLDFTLEAQTQAAMLEHRQGLQHISAERIREELFGILTAPHPTRADLLFSLELFAQGETLAALEGYPPELLPRFAALCRITGEDTLPQRLRCDRLTQRSIARAITFAQSPPTSEADWRILIGTQGEAVSCALAGYLNEMEQYQAVCAQCFPRNLRELALSSTELLARGYSGRALGEQLDALFRHVLAHPKDNHRQQLLNLLERH